jgi:hypothetical protein
MSSQQRSAQPRRATIYRYGCTRDDSILDLARRLGYDLDRLDEDGLPIPTVAEGERALTELHADPDWGDQPSWGRS